MFIDTGMFYFISDQYYVDFPDPYLMQNHEEENGKAHNRPCFYAIKDTETQLLWMVPISSQIDKYKKIAASKVKKFGRCDTIVFCDVAGIERAFLLQNMFPVSEKYISNIYLNARTRKPVRLTFENQSTILRAFRKVYARMRRGMKLVFPDVLAIEAKLKED